MSVGILCSYHYWRNEKIADALNGWDPIVFADSGAFSAKTLGSEIDVHQYAAWLDINRDTVDFACTLDVIGDFAQTAANTEILEAQGHTVVPVFHVGSPWDELRRLCDSYPYVALGGMVPHKGAQKALLRWLVAALQIATPAGTVCHGFGITSMNSVAKLPLYSIDSTTWTNATKYGNVPLWDDMRGVVRIPPHKRKQEAALLTAYGFDVNVLERGFALKADKPKAQFDAEFRQMRRCSLESWCRFERWWHKRFEPIAVPDKPEGPHVYIVVHKGDVQLVSEVATHA